MPRYLKILLGFISVIIVLVLLGGVVLATMDWNRVRPWVNRELTELAHRPVKIDGNLSVHWQRQPAMSGWRRLVPWPVIQAQDVIIDNPPWVSVGPHLLEAQALRVMIDPWALKQHIVRLAELEIHAGHLALEQRQDGANNWGFGDGEKREGESTWEVDLQQLILDDASARYLDAGRELDATARVSTADGDQSPYRTQWQIEGSYHGVAVNGQGRLGEVLALRSGAEPFPVEGELHIGATTLAAEGTVMLPHRLDGLDVQFELAGPTMADLYPILGIALPNTPPYHTKGHLVADLADDAAVWEYRDFTGTVGKSDLRGTLKYEVMAPRPRLSGVLESELLRFKDLGPLVGAETANDVAVPDVDGNGNSDAGGDAGKRGRGDASPKKPAQADGQLTEEAAQPADKALPVEQADTGVWDTMDADVRFKGKRIQSSEKLPLDDVQAHVVLKDSILRLEPLNFGVAGGSLKSTITLDGTESVIQAALDTQARGLQLGKLFPAVESMDAALGSIHGDAKLTGRGNSVSALMSHASGDLHAVVSRGTVSHFLLEAAGLNVANMVMVKLFGDEQVMLECLAADFRIDDGLMQTRTFILEADDAVVTVDGEINLATEEMDLDVHPENKSLRIFTLRSPLYVKGTFKDPDIGVQKGPIAARAGAAVVLGVVAAPLAALLPLLNVGTDDTAQCAIGQTAVKKTVDEDGHLKGSVQGAKPDEKPQP